MTKQAFYAMCPRTRKEFVRKWREDYIFRNWGEVFGFAVIGENVYLPSGVVAGVRVK